MGKWGPVQIERICTDCGESFNATRFFDSQHCLSCSEERKRSRMKYSEIPQFTRSARYSIDISWGYLESWISHQAETCFKFELDPDFQRHHVWDYEKRIRYVEYILRGGRSSRDLYFNCANYMGCGEEGPLQLVDGKQRMEAVRLWLRDDFQVFGHFKSEMEGRLGLTGPGFKIHINDLQTRAEVLQWYLDLNSGGVVHTEEELQRVRSMLAEEKAQ